MRKEKKYFASLRKDVIKYNKALICVLVLYIAFSLICSVSILDCNGIDYYSFTGSVSSEMLTCTNMSNGLLAFFINNKIIISVILLLAALVFLVLQKIALYKINKLDINELEEEKVNKTNHILLTLLLGYTGIHKYKTQNRVIGHIYLVNFVIFVISFLVKTFAEETFLSYLMFYCMFEFGRLFLIGIIILNIVESIFSLISLKDDDEKIFA